MVTFRDFQKEFDDLGLFVENDEETDRLEHVAAYVSRPSTLVLYICCRSNKLQFKNSWKGSAEKEEWPPRYVNSTSPTPRTGVNISQDSRTRNKPIYLLCSTGFLVWPVLVFLYRGRLRIYPGRIGVPPHDSLADPCPAQPPLSAHREHRSPRLDAPRLPYVSGPL